MISDYEKEILYSKAIEYERNGKTTKAYIYHLKLMNKLGDMREYQKVAYSYRLKHGLRPDIKSELRRNYFGCAQFVRLSALLLTETYIWNIVRGLSHFLYETGTYNSEKNDN